MKRHICLAVVFLFCAPSIMAEVWGVKTHDPVSGPPSTLFHFAEDDSGLTVVATITLNSQNTDVDGRFFTSPVLR